MNLRIGHSAPNSIFKLQILGKSIFFISLLILTSCKNTRDTVITDNAVEVVCPGVSKTLILRASAKELREGLRKQYTHDKTRDTVLKLKDGSNIMIPAIKPEHLSKCFVRDSKNVSIPSSLGY